MRSLSALKSFTKAMDAAEWPLRRAVKSKKPEDFWLSAADAAIIADIGPQAAPELGLDERGVVADIAGVLLAAANLNQPDTAAKLETALHAARTVYARVLAVQYHPTAVSEAMAEREAEKSGAAEAAAE